jgi:transcriptional antiterminator RfaH
MPLLLSEPFVFPDDLLTAPPPSADGPSRWWVLHTRPRAEKALARRILAQAVPFFLPLYLRRWCNRGRLLTSELPLFTGYVFFYGDDTARLKVLTTNLVANCLKVLDQKRLRSDLERVWRLMDSHRPLTPAARLRAGEQVEVVAGPLAGVRGRVLRLGKRLTLTIEVQLLQQGVSVEIEDWMLEPLRPALPGGAAERDCLGH